MAAARTSFRERANLEILFVLPFPAEMVKDWVDKFPDQLKDIESWKNPPDQANLERYREIADAGLFIACAAVIETCCGRKSHELWPTLKR